MSIFSSHFFFHIVSKNKKAQISSFPKIQKKINKITPVPIKTQKFIKHESNLVNVRLFSLEKPGVISKNAKKIFNHNFPKLKQNLQEISEKSSTSLADQLRIDIYPLPEEEENVFKSGFVELFAVDCNKEVGFSDIAGFTAATSSASSSEPCSKKRKSLTKLNEITQQQQLLQDSNYVFDQNIDYLVYDYTNQRYCNSNSAYFNKTAENFIQTAWSRPNTGKFCDLAALKMTGQLLVFHNASSGNFGNDISDVSGKVADYLFENGEIGVDENQNDDFDKISSENINLVQDRTADELTKTVATTKTVLLG